MWNEGQPAFSAAGGGGRFERIDKGLAPAFRLGGDDELVFGAAAGQPIDGEDGAAQVAREIDFDLPERSRDVIKGFPFPVGGVAAADAADLDVIEQMLRPEIIQVAAPVSREDADVGIGERGFQPGGERFEKDPFAGACQRARRSAHHQRRQRIVKAVVDDVLDVHAVIIIAKG